MKILITGVSGYIGTRIANLAMKRGHCVIGASRQPVTMTLSSWIPYALDSKPLTLPGSVDVIIHAAVGHQATEYDIAEEVAAANTLITTAKKINAKLIFISSQVARQEAPTPYGRTKWQIEQYVLNAGGFVVRLGLVYGGSEQGLFGGLVNYIRKSPIIPAFLPAPLVQPIHIDDCANGFLKLIESNNITPRIFCLASEPVSFTRFLQCITLCRVRRYRIYLPTPVIVIKLFLFLLKPFISSKNPLGRLHSLFNIPIMNTEKDLNSLELHLRTLRAGMHLSGSDRRRKLIEEGNAFLAYLLKRKPPSMLIRRYVCAIEKLYSGIPIKLPSWLINHPVALALLDNKDFTRSLQGEEFRLRMSVATIIAETSKVGALHFLGANQSSQCLTALVKIPMAIGAELVWRMLSFIYLPFFYKGMRKPRKLI